MKHAYMIQAGPSTRPTATLRCSSAWIAYEQYNRLVRRGQKVRILNRSGEQVTIEQLEAAAQAETGAPVNSSDEAGTVPISVRNLLMGS
ncbi:MAG: hypothetical protein MIL41_04820 [Hyphomicrobiales bacterium]